MVWVILCFDTWMPFDFMLPISNSSRQRCVKTVWKKSNPSLTLSPLTISSVKFAIFQDTHCGVNKLLWTVHTKNNSKSLTCLKTLKKEVNNFVVVDWLCKTLKAGNRDWLHMLSLECLCGFGDTIKDMINFKKGVQSGLIPKPPCQDSHLMLVRLRHKP